MTKTKGTAAAGKPAAKKSSNSKKPRTKPADDPRVAGAFKEDGSFSAYATSGSKSGGKFWRVLLPAGGLTMTVTFGKIETNGQSRDTAFDSHEKAVKGAIKKLREKLDKGYQLAMEPDSDGENNNAEASE